MKFVSWNIRGNTGVGRKRRPAIARVLAEHEPDVIVLQEVPDDDFVEYLSDALVEHGLKHVEAGEVERAYGNLLVSRWPLRELPSGWCAGPRADAVSGRVVESPAGEFVALSVHVPNGSANGWVKVETLEALARSIHEIDVPILLGGDFNEPKKVLGDGTVIPFMMNQDADGSWHMRGYRTRNGRRFPRARWVRAVRSVLGREPSVSLVHVYRKKHGQDAAHVPHVVRGKDRVFDHVLVSPSWTVLKAGYDDSCRLNGTSDHSLAWAEVAFR